MLPLPVLSGAGQNPSRPSVCAGQPHPVKWMVNVHAKTALTEPALESRSSQLSGAGTGLAHLGPERLLPRGYTITDYGWNIKGVNAAAGR
jgi:hypothetical protein